MLCAKPRVCGLTWLLSLTLMLVVSGQAMAQSVTFQFVETEYKDVFQTLGEIAGLNVLVDKSVTGTGSFYFNDVDLNEALALVAKFSSADYLIKDNTLLVASKERMIEFQESQLYYIHTEYIKPQDAVPVLRMILPPENIHASGDSNLLVLYGSADQLAQAQAALKQLDVPARSDCEQEDSALAILQTLAEELGLNLVADPSLAEISIVANIRNHKAKEALELIAEQAGLELSFTGETLVANRKKAVDDDDDGVVEQPQDKIKVYRLNYTDPAVVSRMIQLIIPADRIQIDENTKSILIRATVDQLEEVDQFIAAYDQPLPQILLEVWIHEISDDVSQAFGLDWDGNLPGFQVGAADPDSLFQVELDWEPWQVLFALEALEQQGKAKILARPKIATLSGQEAMFFVGDRIPIVLADEEGNQNIDFLESGINLSVLPRISEDGLITIEVRPEVSLFKFVEGTEYPQIRTREARTTVRVKAGQPVLIGGLIQEQEHEEVNKVPFVGDLPIIGRLFRKAGTITEKTEMSIILIPRIIDGSEGLVAGPFFQKLSDH